MRLPATVTRRALASLFALSCSPPALRRAHAATQADRVDTTTGKLILNQPPTIDVRVAPPAVTSRCFLDVSIGGAPAERLEVELYGNIAPKAAENFRCLCTGEKGFGYAGSSFYKLVDGLALQGGDVSGNGEGKSIYGEPFEHDNVCGARLSNPPPQMLTFLSCSRYLVARTVCDHSQRGRHGVNGEQRRGRLVGHERQPLPHSAH